MPDIKITGAREGNLKNISVEIPKNKLVVFTGLSGSGKSTLLIDVLFNECQRQYLEAMSMQGIHKPLVDRIQGVSPGILITQTNMNTNPRSTVGTMTDVYTDLRMVYEKLGQRSCPYCGHTISAADCREETEKINDDFHVYMYCSECGRRMDKITRTLFSFNTREGACSCCEGLGKVHSVRQERVLDESLALEEGAVRYWEKQYGKYQISVFHAACRHFGMDVPQGIPVKEFSKAQKELLLNGVECGFIRDHFPDIKPPATVALGKFEGAVPILWRRLADKEGDAGAFAEYFDVVECPECKGERLSQAGRSVTVNGMRLPELSGYSLEQLHGWIGELTESLAPGHYELVEAYIRDIHTKLMRFIHVGLGYLSLDRQIITLSGGELQRLRLAAVLDSELTGVIYILDEPTAGLHPRDTAGLITILRNLRDLGNTVLVIEHDEDVMAGADYIVDMGPGAGKRGGEIVASGTLAAIKACRTSVTGQYLSSFHPVKTQFRKASGSIRIQNAVKYNLKHMDVSIPTGCLSAVTGPSGSGKSTLVFEVLAKGNAGSTCNMVSGLECFDRIVEIGQAPISKMKRSNVATYSEVYSLIRALFASTQEAKAGGLPAKYFSFNTPGGRCENCMGLGYVDSNMLFFNNIEVVCPVCGGRRFDEKVLSVKYRGHSIRDVLDMSVEEAADFFEDHPKIMKILKLLIDVGLGYLELGQTLTTLSGGEGQRLKLAKELILSSKGKKNLYLMDEPTTGLHPKDVEHFLLLLNRMADAGNTVVVVEHNKQLILNCDWIIDLGPGGGDKGGEVMFTGTPDLFFRGL